MRIIAVSNQKGGVGKTTAVLNLGAALAEAGRRVLLVDMDPQGQLGIGLGLDVGALPRTIGQALESRSGLREVILGTGIPGLELCPANASLALAEKALHASRARELALRRCLEGLPGYDVCLIDTPPSMGLLAENALCAARELIVPTLASYYALEGTFGLLNMAEALARDLEHRLEILAVFINQFDPRLKTSSESEAQLREFFGSRLMHTRVRVNAKINEAQQHRRSIFDEAPRSHGAEDFRALAREIFRLP